jgi:paraquat-inducible protein A
MSKPVQIACHECDLLLDLEHMVEGNKALCPRCGYTLTAVHKKAVDKIVAYSSAGLIFLLLASIFPFITFSAQGQDRTVTLFQSIAILVTERFPELSILIFLFVIVFPAVLLLCILYVYISIKNHAIYPGSKFLLKLIVFLQPWSMSEIFLISILVSFIKVASLADVSLNMSFAAYVLFVCSTTIVLLNLDKHQAWKLFTYGYGQQPRIEPGSHVSCHVCTGVLPNSADYCKVCDSSVHHRKTASLQITWALLFTSILLYVPANILPIMHTTFLGKETESTILGGVILLWSHGSYPIAIVIFLASVLIPVGKILALIWLCLSVKNTNARTAVQKTRLYRMTEFIGRWSMVDVFVVAVLVALIQMGNMMSIHPGLGALAFAGMVILSVFAADSYDPRLMWDSMNERED